MPGIPEPQHPILKGLVCPASQGEEKGTSSSASIVKTPKTLSEKTEKAGRGIEKGRAFNEKG